MHELVLCRNRASSYLYDRVTSNHIVGYGAPAKVTTFCHVFNLGNNEIKYIKNPYYEGEVMMYPKWFLEKYFNKPTIHYTPPPPTTTLIKYKPMPHDTKELPLSMRWFNGP